VDEAAQALKHATSAMRKKNVPLHRWLPLVHMGV
jgi:hypothetical protein